MKTSLLFEAELKVETGHEPAMGARAGGAAAVAQARRPEAQSGGKV